MPYDIAHRLIRPDGSIRWVQEHAIVERDSAGRATRMVGTVQDVTERYLAVEALRTSEAEFRLLAEAMPQIVWITRPDGANVYFNQHWMDYTGMSLEASLGDGWTEPFHPDDKALAWEAWQNATTTIGTYAVECRLRRADGAYRWWLIRGVPVKDASGTILKWFGTCTDVDSLKQGEERLRVLHDVGEVMRTALDPVQAIPAALWILGRHLRVSRCVYATVDVDGVHCDVSRDYIDRCASMEGRQPLAALGADLVATPVPVVVRDVDVERGAPGPAGVKAFVSCSLIAHGTLRAVMSVHQSTSRDWTAGEISIVHEVANRCWAAIEKSGADSKLRESEALLRIAGRAARLGGWSMSFPDHVITWSDEACAIHEVPFGTVPDLDRAITFYASECRETIRNSIEACLRDGTPFDVELQIVTAKDRRVWVRAIGNAERNSSGTITTIRGAIQDIDNHRKLQDQFRQAQKMEAVGRLAGGVAHDFNNLLTVILSCAELASEGLIQGDPLHADLAEIRKAGGRATALTGQLLAFSRQQVLAPRVIDVDAVLAGMKPMLGRLLGADIHLTLLSSPPVGSVIADPQQIEQVVMNLAVNARDAMPRGGNLTIETTNVSVDATDPGDVPEGDFVMLAVTDSGVGMGEATRARVFEPFFTTKEMGKGTGLGLATVFGIVHQSAGHVRVYSELEHGTTFKLYLPRTDRPVTAVITAALPIVLDGAETILLVEDEDQVRAVSCTILRKHGYNVLEASNGGEAFLVSKDFPARIDLLLTDVVMPRLSGRKLAEQLAQHRPEMKVLFASGYTDDTVLQHGVLDSGVAFLQKPFTPHTLLKKVREVLDADFHKVWQPLD